MSLSVKVECECVGLNSLLSGLSSWPCPRYFEKKKNVSNNVMAVILNRSKYIKVLKECLYIVLQNTTCTFSRVGTFFKLKNYT